MRNVKNKFQNTKLKANESNIPDRLYPQRVLCYTASLMFKMLTDLLCRKKDRCSAFNMNKVRTKVIVKVI